MKKNQVRAINLYEIIDICALSKNANLKRIFYGQIEKECHYK